MSLDPFEDLCQMTEQLFEDEELVNEKRDSCQRCERPINVCLCSYFPEEIIKASNKVKIWVFQHPYEIKRCLRTTLILEKCLSEDNFEILISKRFSIQKFNKLKEVYENEHTYVLYPSAKSISIETLPKLSDFETNLSMLHIIILDGTWQQASGIYFTNPEIQNLKQIKIDGELISAYTIRTQPREFFLSTLETVALTLSRIEEQPQIYNDLVKPLKALCDFQFQHGAQPHQSKEYLIMNGLYKKAISKKNLIKLTKDSKFMQNSGVGENNQADQNS